MNFRKDSSEKAVPLAIPTLRRYWQSTGTSVPYRGIHDLKPGELWWSDNPRPTKFTQHYVSIDGLEAGSSDLEHRPVVYDEDISRGLKYIPAEAAIARELVVLGAEWSILSDCFTGGRTFLRPNLVCVQPAGELAAILEKLREATGRPNLGGFPDVIAKLKDGSIAFREAKYVAKKYRDVWGPKQEDMASTAVRLWPGKVDVAVVEWGDQTKH
jgi:hypothetical protein